MGRQLFPLLLVVVILFGGCLKQGRIPPTTQTTLERVLSSTTTTQPIPSTTTTQARVNVTSAPPDRPRGIYSLDGKEGVCRDARIRDYPFVDGYAWRMGWTDFETAEGEYDFSKIDCIFSKLPAGQKLTILLQASAEPGYITSKPGVTIWTYADMNPRHENYNVPLVRPVPWDRYARERFRAFMKALGDHRVPDAGGIPTPLRDHPSLGQIVTVVPGLGAIRESDGVRISALPGYSRVGFIESVRDDLHAATDEFPNKFVAIGFWRVNDGRQTPALWEDVRTMVLSEFDGVRNPKVGFYMENLAASRDSTGAVSGTPIPEYAAPLYQSKDSTFIMFQALTAWSRPFTGAEKVANAGPADGIKYAYETYDCRYFEIYTPDLDNSNYESSLKEWHDRIKNG